MLLALYLILNIIAAHLAINYSYKLNSCHILEYYMLQLLLRFVLIVLVFIPFTERVPLMALAVLGPLFYFSLNYLVNKLLNRLLSLTLGDNELLARVVEVAALSLIYVNIASIA